MHIYPVNIAMDFICLLFVLFTNMMLMNDLLVILCYCRCQCMYKVVCHPNINHMCGSRLLKYLMVRNIQHGFLRIGLLSNLGPNVRLNRMFMDPHRIILDSRRYHGFTWYQFNHLMAMFHIIDIWVITILQAITIYLLVTLPSLILCHI